MALGETHWDVDQDVRQRANRAAGIGRARWNTYRGHGLAPGRGERRTVDFWNLGGRGDPLPEAKGDAICSWVIGQHQVQPVALVIWYSWWWRPGFGWVPYPGLHGNHGPGADAHVHVGWQ